MQAVEIIRRKRDGLSNSSQEIRFLVSGAIQGHIPAYQLSAWLMAVFLHGMDEVETTALTEALIHSGQVLDFSRLPGVRVDKHSTGGVGDKTSLVIAPLVASAGVYVPMVSGRGLGHTGGTLDKLESIPGFRTNLSLDEFRDTVSQYGLALIGQTEEVAPADRMLYAIRDVTATVESIPLIVASIVSKKVAEGVDGLVLDVKTGHGAFMKRLSDSERLAQALVATCRKMNKKVVAVISDMSQPLGRMIGNALEVREAIDTLKGDGPEDLTYLCLELSAHMLMMGKRIEDVEEARSLARKQLESGAALEKFQQLVEIQGGNPRVVEQDDLLPKSKAVFEYRAELPGYLQEARAGLLGQAAMRLGAGRECIDSEINHAVGLQLMKKIGDRISPRECLLRVYYDDERRLKEALEVFAQAYTIGEQELAPPVLIQRVIS